MKQAPRLSDDQKQRLASCFQEDQDTGCLVWTSRFNKKGSPVFRIGGKDFFARHVLWQQRHACLPDGETLKSVCKNRSCVNPAHLMTSLPEPTIERRAPVARPPASLAVEKPYGLHDPLQDAAHAKRKRAMANATHCARGHELTDENLVMREDPKSGTMDRRCRECAREAMEAHERDRQRRQAEAAHTAYLD